MSLKRNLSVAYKPQIRSCFGVVANWATFIYVVRQLTRVLLKCKKKRIPRVLWYVLCWVHREYEWLFVCTYVRTYLGNICLPIFDSWEWNTQSIIGWQFVVHSIMECTHTCVHRRCNQSWYLVDNIIICVHCISYGVYVHLCYCTLGPFT